MISTAWPCGDRPGGCRPAPEALPSGSPLPDKALEKLLALAIAISPNRPAFEERVARYEHSWSDPSDRQNKARAATAIGGTAAGEAEEKGHHDPTSLLRCEDLEILIAEWRTVP
jgi:hypothetical protein